jgi:hypothetical protein
LNHKLFDCATRNREIRITTDIAAQLAASNRRDDCHGRNRHSGAFRVVCLVLCSARLVFRRLRVISLDLDSSACVVVVLVIFVVDISDHICESFESHQKAV